MTTADVAPLDSKTSRFDDVGMRNATPIGTRLRELGKTLTMMKAEGHGSGVIVPGKLKEFLTNLAAVLAPLSVTRRATKQQIHQLSRAIIDHGRMVSQFYSRHTVGMEERELAFRFRETTHNIVSALVLLEK